MEKIIDSKKNLIAIILRQNYKNKGINFFTPNDFSQQLGIMSHNKGHIIKSHTHKINQRTINYTQEVLIIKSGKIKVNLFDSNLHYLQSEVLKKGDLILLASGGHGFEVLEKTTMYEIKQGPYNKDEDKTLLDV